MFTRRFPLAALLLAWSVAGFAGDDSQCALQDNAECLKVLEVRAATAARPRASNRELYAVLVNGDTSALHNGNIERSYEVLRALGVPDSNVYILSNSNPRPGIRTQPPSLVTARATTGNLASVLAYVTGEIDGNDCLLVYTTGHGIREKGKSAVVLNDGLLLESDMLKALKRMTPAVSVLVMDQCFSGGFADAVQASGLNTIVIASTDSRHETYCEYFAGAFWLSLLEPEADINRDGRVTLNESYEVAMTLHRMALADTPERTHCRFVASEGQAEPAVVLNRHMLTWDATSAAPERESIGASAEEPPRPEFRRSRIAGRQGGYRPHE